jgi:aspartyl-tRNA(Asn)/glutamyl-tRNA(Gln) amidotransferase subunit B
MISVGTISGKIGKELLTIVVDTGSGDLLKVVDDWDLRQVTDLGAIDSAVDAVIAANSNKAEQAKTKPGMLGWFVGEVMKATGGKANPQAVRDTLKRRLGV